MDNNEKQKEAKLYYEIKCPKCNAIITKVFDKNFKSNFITCPNCHNDVLLYSLFSYNMWLAENGNSIKTDKRPIKSEVISKNSKEVPNIFEIALNQLGYTKVDDEESENNRIFTFLKQNEDYIDEDNEGEETSNIPKTNLNLELLNRVGLERALIIQAHFKHLIDSTELERSEVIEIIKSLIDNELLF